MRILLVDDDPIVRDLLSSNLAEQGFSHVTSANSAEDALSLVEQQEIPFDCYLLDIMLEMMDGIELCRQLRERAECKAAPIIMITSGQTADLMERAFSAGATDFLRKPLDQMEVAGRIRTAMLLVETTKKEHRSRHALQSLMSHASDLDLIDVSQRICFPDVSGMLDYFQLENRLLRMQDGQYQMSLFRLQIDEFQSLNANCGSGEMLKLVQSISNEISEAISTKRLWFAYLGAGTFICCVVGRYSEVSTPFQELLQEAVSDAIKGLASEKRNEVRTSIFSLSEMRIMPRNEAIALIRREFNVASQARASALPEIGKIEELIFAKIDEACNNIFHED